MPSINPAAALFDLDNTLTSRANDIVAFAAIFATDFSEQLHTIDLDELTSILVEIDCGGYNPRKAEELRERLVWRSTPSAASLEEHWQHRFADSVLPRPGMIELLDHLIARGLKIGLVTNGGVYGQNRKVDRLGVRDRIQSLIVSEAVGAEKPDARIFELACRDLGVLPNECWFVGDHPINDVLASMRVGMTGIWIRDAESGHTWPETEPRPDFKIETLHELADLLGKA